MLQNFLNLEGVKKLSKKELGFFNGGSCSGTCAFQGGNGYTGIAGVCKEWAIAGSAATGGHWCCDSCSSASWLEEDLIYWE